MIIFLRSPLWIRVCIPRSSVLRCGRYGGTYGSPFARLYIRSGRGSSSYPDSFRSARCRLSGSAPRPFLVCVAEPFRRVLLPLFVSVFDGSPCTEPPPSYIRRRLFLGFQPSYVYRLFLPFSVFCER